MSVVNIVELQNVVTNATGQGDIAALTTSVQNMQKMVKFDSKTILTNIIGRYDQSPIVVKDPMSFASSIQITGSITVNGTTLGGDGSGSLSTSLLSTLGAMAIVDTASTGKVYYTNLVVASTSTLLVAGSILPTNTNSNLGSAENYWKSIYVGTGTIYIGPTGTVGYNNEAVSIGPKIASGGLDITKGTSTISLYTDGMSLIMKTPSGGTGAIGSSSAITFDAGNAFSNYVAGPAFDCGSAI